MQRYNLEKIAISRVNLQSTIDVVNESIKINHSNNCIKFKMNIFNVIIEFDKQKLWRTIQQCIESHSKGYVCVVDGNVLANAHKVDWYREIINLSLLNICDGSSIALLTNLIYKTNYSAFTGPMIFKELLHKNYKQLLLGNTDEILNQIRAKLIKEGRDINNYGFKSLPFRTVDEFDYNAIAEEINESSYDIIWVSLGAPKQEIFVSRLTPLLNKGIVFAIGAAFNLILDEKEEAKLFSLMKRIHLGWLIRVAKEPKRIGSRAWKYFRILPELIFEEYRKKNKKIVSNETVS